MRHDSNADSQFLRPLYTDHRSLFLSSSHDDVDDANFDDYHDGHYYRLQKSDYCSFVCEVTMERKWNDEYLDCCYCCCLVVMTIVVHVHGYFDRLVYRDVVWVSWEMSE